MGGHHSMAATGRVYRLGRVCLVAILLQVLTAEATEQRPFRGAVPISVLLCKYADAVEPIPTKEFYEDFTINPGAGGLADYWNAVSFGGIVLTGSTVKGWYGLSKTSEETKAYPRNKRTQKYRDCIERINRFYDPPDDHIVVVVTTPRIDTFGMPGGAFMGVGDSVGAMAHEVGHGMVLSHSFSNTRDPATKEADWESLGEYDNMWDLMSYARVFSTNTGRYGFGGPGLSAYHRDRMGWIARDKILRFGADGRTDRTVTLTALNKPDGRGYQMVRIPFVPRDPFTYYTVEYRTADGWDSGFPSDVVLIHMVTYKSFEPAKKGKKGYYSFLFRQESGSRGPIQSINRDGVRIDVVSTDPANGRATVRIRSTGVQKCVGGLVWREATRDDKVCVSAARRNEVRNENARGEERIAPGTRVQGNIRCRSGFVWRESSRIDQVCVTPASREIVRQENNNAASRTIGGAAYGPNSCKQGFVWRDADERDWVCVTAQRRAEVQAENESADSRRQSGGGAYGPDTCRSGFVWRDAFPGDRICVTRDSRQKVQEENRSAGDRLAKKEA